MSEKKGENVTFEQHSFEKVEKNKATMLMFQYKTHLKFSANLSQYFCCFTVFFFAMDEFNRMPQASDYWFIL